MGNYQVVDHASQPVIESAPGNRARVFASASTGSKEMSVVERWLDPGALIATHTHPTGIEEVIWIRGGQGRFRVGDEEVILDEENTIVIPPGTEHCIESVGDAPLWFLARYSSATPTTVGEDLPPWVNGF